MTEEREVEYVLIDNKKYEVVMEKTSGDTTYMYLSNLDDDNDNLIRKYTTVDQETIYPLDNDEEFELAMSLIEG
ncbi:MAG: hypothetical protein UE699_05255 [Bacilli bacterium]|nr:hypothetical protein [Bacilli bacterium]